MWNTYFFSLISCMTSPAIVKPKIAVMWATVPFICAFDEHHSWFIRFGLPAAIFAFGHTQALVPHDDALPLLKEFEDFSRKVMCLDTTNVMFAQNANVYRVGVTNAADRGLDMYSNWGPAIQIKHLTLDEELAKSIVEGVTSDKIIIVCIK